MIVNSHNIEFGYELLSALPYAYELYLKGELTETISGQGSEPLYYFSPKHTINKEPRSWFNTPKARKDGIPNVKIHTPERAKQVFPPYKEVYANNEYKWSKPTLCICNRYNKEWNQPPINFFDNEILDWLFTNLKKKYHIVYFAVDIPEEIQDNAHSMELNDREIAKKHRVTVFNDLVKNGNWNEVLLKVFANCQHYVTMNGGYSILASMFGGENIIYSTRRGNYHCHELTHKSFWRWYPNHANQRTIGVESYNELKEWVNTAYIDSNPIANIIVRTSGRPNAFKTCLKSIHVQTYKNINIVVTTDDEKTKDYTRQFNVRHLDMSHIVTDNTRVDNKNYGIPFKQNLYLKEALNRIDKGYIIYLDDDDMFTSKYSLETIMQNVEENKLLVWKVNLNNTVIPNGSFGKEIKLYDITGIGFAHHVKHRELTDWSEWKRADYRTAKKLSDNLPVKWLDAILTKIQGSPGMGRKIDIVPTNKGYMKTVKVINPIIGKVGCIKRLPKPIAAEMVEKGYAEYLSDVVDNLNKPVEVIGKPIVTENKQVNPVEENKKVKENDPKPTANSNKRVRATRTVKGKRLPKAK